MRWKVALIAIMALLLGGGVLAAEVMQATICTVEADEVVDGNLLAVCRELHIEGRVDGDVFAIALTAHITGEVTGNLYIGARALEVSGTLGDDLHYIGGTLELKSGTVWDDGSLVAAAVSVTLEDDTRVPGDVSAVGYQLRGSGVIDGDVMYAGESLTLSGSVGRSVYAHVGDTSQAAVPQVASTVLSLFLALDTEPPGLRLTRDARIGRDLDYIAPAAADLSGRVQGSVSYTPVTNAPTIEELVDEESRSNALRQYFGQVVQDTLVMTIMGSLLLLVAPAVLKRPTRAVGERVVTNAVLGVGTFVLSFPVLLLSVAVSVLIVALLALLSIDAITGAAAVTFGLVNIGGGSLFYYICGYMARLAVAAALGTFILERISAKELTIRDWMLAVGVGASIVALATSLPAVGWMVNLIVVGIGLGAILRLLWKITRPPVITTPGPMRVVLTPPAVMTLPPQLPPPLVDDTPPARGMDNLPEGFRWWDDE